MAYLAVDKDGTCAIYEDKPEKGSEDWNPIIYPSGCQSPWMYIPNSTMLRIAGRILTWEDEPFEIID